MNVADRWVAREALLAASIATVLAAWLVSLGPPGSDLAAHVYQRTVFLEHGFVLWNNFWYAGHYSFITYSLLYYPLAALIGIRLLAVATIAAAALAFAAVLGREFGVQARWSIRTFAVVWSGVVLTAAFPFTLGVALALLAIWALQGERLRGFAVLAALVLAASPLAFVLLALILGGIALGRNPPRRVLAGAGLALTVVGLGEALIMRAFPTDGRYPFPLLELLAALTFCALGAALTRGVEAAVILRPIFAVYSVACTAAYLLPSEVGGNIARLRFVALPIYVLVLGLRRWKPRALAAVALGLALSWNLSPLIASYASGRSDPAAEPTYWAPAISYLKAHMSMSYRVEVVDTVGHWEAVYLPKAGIPIVRGWFRQDDFPQNQILYEQTSSKGYLQWLRTLGARYVVLTDAPPDYSARGEASRLRSRESGLRPVLHTPRLTIYAVPSPRPIVTGSAGARVVALTEQRVTLRLPRPGRYRLAIRYSAYWHAKHACVAEGSDGMMTLHVERAGLLDLRFDVDPGRLLSTIAGDARRCTNWSRHHRRLSEPHRSPPASVQGPSSPVEIRPRSGRRPSRTTSAPLASRGFKPTMKGDQLRRPAGRIRAGSHFALT